MSIAVLAYLAVINIITFGLYGLDKYRAMNNMWRIPEKTLLGVAAIGGAYGAYLGMRIFHHKTKHLKFQIGVPIMMLVWKSFCHKINPYQHHNWNPNLKLQMLCFMMKNTHA